MKKLKPILLAIAALSILSFTLKETTFFEENLEDVGVIKQSLLKPNQFNKTQKGTWVLLDGSQIQKDTRLFELLQENFNLDILTLKDSKYYLPNASGTFIRCSNINGQGYDPDKDRKAGSIQNDAIKKHAHTFTKLNFNHRAGTHNNNKNFNANNDLETKDNTSATGGSETRPVNISMYTYIKISN